MEDIKPEDVTFVMFTKEQKRWNKILQEAKTQKDRFPILRESLDDEEALNLEIIRMAEKNLKELEK